MALMSRVSSVSDEPVFTAALGATTSTAEIILGVDCLYRIVASGNINIKYGVSGMGAASATDFLLPGNVVYVETLGHRTDRIRIFNPTAGSINYFVQKLSRTS